MPLPTHPPMNVLSKLNVASWGVSSLGFYWGLPGGHGPHSGLVLPRPCPAEIMYRLLGLRPVLKGPRPHNTALWLPQDTMDLVLCPRVVGNGSVSSPVCSARAGMCQVTAIICELLTWRCQTVHPLILASYGKTQSSGVKYFKMAGWTRLAFFK